MSSQEAIEERAGEAFAFLVRDHGFSEPRVRRDTGRTVLAWLRDPLGIEVVLNWRQGDVTVLLVRLEDGELPAGYYVSAGRRCRVYLATWLASLGKLDRKPKAGGGGPGEHLERYGELLERHLDVLLADPQAPFSG